MIALSIFCNGSVGKVHVCGTLMGSTVSPSCFLCDAVSYCFNSPWSSERKLYLFLRQTYGKCFVMKITENPIFPFNS